MPYIFNNLLIISSSPQDIRLIAPILQQDNLAAHVNIAHDYNESLDALRISKYKHTIPQLILLDLDSPDLEDKLLEYIRSDAELRSSIIIALSEFSSKIQHAFNYNIAGYFQKPIDKDNFESALETFKSYWRMNIKPTYH